MLFNPDWDKTDRVYNGVSLRVLAAWLETMPPNERYDFRNPFDCVLAQYMKAQGLPAVVEVPEDGWITDVSQGDGYDEDWTFGAALERARAVSSQDREAK